MYSRRGVPKSRNSVSTCGRFEAAQVCTPIGPCTDSCDLEFLEHLSDSDPPAYSSQGVRKHQDCKLSSPKLDFSKFAHQNVFIESYYPTVHADKSQNSSNSAFPQSKSNDSLENSQTFRRPLYSRASFTNLKVTKLGHLCNQSGTTIDSKTYTLFSQISDKNAVCNPVTGSRGDFIGKKSRCFFEHPRNNRQLENSTSPLISDPVACLHQRVQTLEGLLQKALVGATFSREQKPRRKQRTIKKENSVPRAQSVDRSTSSEVEEIYKTGNSDTEHELLIIKKRLNELEKKLQTGRSTDFKSNWETSSRNMCVTYMDALKKQKCCECTNPKNLNFGSEVEHSSSSSEENERRCKEKTSMKRHKVKKEFKSKCKILKQKSSKNFKPLACSSSNEILYKCSEIIKKGRTYCCYSFPTEKKLEDSLTKIIYVRCQNNRNREAKPRKKRFGKKRRNTGNLCKKNSKTNILVLRSKENQTEITKLFLGEDSRKSRSESFGFDVQEKLSRKKQQLSHIKVEEEINEKSEVADNKINLWETSVKCGPGCWTRCPLCCPPPNGWWPQIGVTREEKSPERGKLYWNPLEILKRGGKIKIPVLFEELYKAPKEKILPRKASNISMRLIFVKQDNRNPLNHLKKFIQKLSQSPTPKSPYVGG